MDTTATLLMRARRMDTMDRIGLLADCLSVRGRGSMVRDGWEAGAGRMDGADVRGTDIRVGGMSGAVPTGMLDMAMRRVVMQDTVMRDVDRHGLIMVRALRTVATMVEAGSMADAGNSLSNG
jgi:hypothetical protein